ncbi:DUF3667 domain-containing protein [Lacihabitans sp. LS3-19]|uniref:DUF3667 domain-containing protein n=1 Tax=Lacihabitans sp. LS3-19 TaxID=2487335 RepID=UPI0020CC926E|nr:DUF3667 domain-containing protein [Lacihabitans sp. LS3-19]
MAKLTTKKGLNNITTTCKNCDYSFEGNFCNNCGQTANTHDINFHEILHEIQHSILHIDKGILFTTKELFKRPGNSIREYIFGKRVKHFKPFAYILLLSTIYALLSKFSDKTTDIDQMILGYNNGSNTVLKGKEDLIVDVLHWMQQHYAYTTLLLIPIISLASYLSFFKTKYNYFQHLILNTFIAGQKTAIFLLMLPIVYFIKDNDLNDSIDTFKVYLGIFLTFLTYYQFFDSTKPVKRIFLTVLTYIVMVILIFVIVLIFGILIKLI